MSSPPSLTTRTDTCKSARLEIRMAMQITWLKFKHTVVTRATVVESRWLCVASDTHSACSFIVPAAALCCVCANCLCFFLFCHRFVNFTSRFVRSFGSFVSTFAGTNWNDCVQMPQFTIICPVTITAASMTPSHYTWAKRIFPQCSLGSTSKYEFEYEPIKKWIRIRADKNSVRHRFQLH